MKTKANSGGIENNPKLLMKLSYFVSISAVILLGWMMATFLRDVPSGIYPKLGHSPATPVLEEKVIETSALQKHSQRGSIVQTSFSN